jgi:hypothetical protein
MQEKSELENRIPGNLCFGDRLVRLCVEFLVFVGLGIGFGQGAWGD